MVQPEISSELYQRMNVEGKLDFALRADRLLYYTLANKHMDTSIQKGEVPAFQNACKEQTIILYQLIRETKAEKRSSCNLARHSKCI